MKNPRFQRKTTNAQKKGNLNVESVNPPPCRHHEATLTSATTFSLNPTPSTNQIHNSENPSPINNSLSNIQHINIVILEKRSEIFYELILGFVQDTYLNPWFNPQVNHYKRTYEYLRALGLNHGRSDRRVR